MDSLRNYGILKYNSFLLVLKSKKEAQVYDR